MKKWLCGLLAYPSNLLFFFAIFIVLFRSKEELSFLFLPNLLLQICLACIGLFPNLPQNKRKVKSISIARLITGHKRLFGTKRRALITAVSLMIFAFLPPHIDFLFYKRTDYSIHFLYNGMGFLLCIFTLLCLERLPQLTNNKQLNICATVESSVFAISIWLQFRYELWYEFSSPYPPPSIINALWMSLVLALVGITVSYLAYNFLFKREGLIKSNTKVLGKTLDLYYTFLIVTLAFVVVYIISSHKVMQLPLLLIYMLAFLVIIIFIAMLITKKPDTSFTGRNRNWFFMIFSLFVPFGALMLINVSQRITQIVAAKHWVTYQMIITFMFVYCVFVIPQDLKKCTKSK